jgi:hypothetical protein
VTPSSFAIVLVDARHRLPRRLISPYLGLRCRRSQQFDDDGNCRICLDAIVIVIVDNFLSLLSQDKDIDFNCDIVCLA